MDVSVSFSIERLLSVKDLHSGHDPQELIVPFFVFLIENRYVVSAPLSPFDILPVDRLITCDDVSMSFLQGQVISSRWR